MAAAASINDQLRAATVSQSEGARFQNDDDADDEAYGNWLMDQMYAAEMESDRAAMMFFDFPGYGDGSEETGRGL